MITLLIGFAAVNTGNNLLFLVVSGLLAFMSVTGVAGMKNIKYIFPVLIPPEEVYAGIPAAFKLSIRNDKLWIPSFLIRFKCGSGRSFIFPVVPHKSTHHDTLFFTFNQRGRASLGRITISSPYPAGFFTRYVSFDSGRTITVFPGLLPTDSGGSGEEVSVTGFGLRRERGVDGELERIYPYTASEPLRMIHWKHSARSGDLLVKGFDKSVAAPVVIDLDSLAGGVEERLSRAAWLVQHWVHERPVGLKTGGHVFPAGIGRRHGLNLLQELALYGRD